MGTILTVGRDGAKAPGIGWATLAIVQCSFFSGFPRLGARGQRER